MDKHASCPVFINGKYWGIYNLREKLNKHFFKTNYDIDDYSIDMIKNYGKIQSGTSAHYSNMLHYLRNNDITDSVHYKYLSTQMDIDNFMDYVGCELYFVNTDWPCNNNKWWRPRSPEGKWQWIIYDTDGMGDDRLNAIHA